MDPLDPFFTQYERDLESGGPRPLEAYQALWPDQANDIASVYAELQRTQPVDPGTPWWDASARPLDSVGPYRVHRPLGAGGMGAVYLAEQDHPKRAVALKVLRPERVSPMALKRFEYEAELLGRVQHPGIAQIYGAGTARTADGEVPYIAMQYVQGDPLSAVLKRSAHRTEAETSPRTTPTRADLHRDVRIIEKVARALQAAHDAGVIHRDVKPGNIILTADDEPVLVDFGIARDQERRLVPLTQTGEAPGTPLYMAPEQAIGGDVDHRADVWALGITLYELLVGHRPFEGATPEAVRRRIVEEELPPARRLARDLRLPLDLAVVIETALRKDRTRRYASTSALANDLQAWREGRPIDARPVSLLGRCARWARREPALAGLLAVLLITLPTVATLVTRHLENLPRLAAAEAAERARERDRLLSLAFLELGDGSSREALAGFEAALALDATSKEAVGGRLLALLELGRVDEAEAILADPRCVIADSDAHEELSDRVMRRRDPSAPSETIGRGHPPRTALDFFIKGQSLLSMGHAASSHGTRPPATFANAIETFTRAALMRPEANQLYLIEAAHAATHARDPVACHRFAQVLEERFGESAPAMHRVGLAYEAGGYPDKALTALERAQELDPKWYQPPLHIGRILKLRKDYEPAEAALRRAVALRRNGIALFNLASCLNDAGRRREAISLYDEAIAADPNRPHGYYNRAMAHEAEGDTDRAIDDFQRVVDIAPHWKWASMHLGRLLSARKEFDRAEKLLRSWTTRRPDDPTGWRNLGSVLRGAGRTADAIEVYERAIEIHPKDADLRLQLGHAIWTSDPKRSESAYLAATRLRPEDADAWHYVGRMRQVQSRYREALEAFERAGALRPHGAWNNRAQNDQRIKRCRAMVR